MVAGKQEQSTSIRKLWYCATCSRCEDYPTTSSCPCGAQTQGGTGRSNATSEASVKSSPPPRSFFTGCTCERTTRASPTYARRSLLGATRGCLLTSAPYAPAAASSHAPQLLLLAQLLLLTYLLLLTHVLPTTHLLSLTPIACRFYETLKVWNDEHDTVGLRHIEHECTSAGLTHLPASTIKKVEASGANIQEFLERCNTTGKCPVHPCVLSRRCGVCVRGSGMRRNDTNAADLHQWFKHGLQSTAPALPVGIALLAIALAELIVP